MSKREKEFVNGLRELADWIEDHPGFVNPAECDSWYLLKLCHSREDLAKAVQTLGNVEKRPDGNYFNVRRYFGPLIIEAYISREQVCTKIVKGTRFVPERVVEAYEEQIVEWECSDPLLTSLPKKEN